jgi:hypothetical protein
MSLSPISLLQPSKYSKQDINMHEDGNGRAKIGRGLIIIII